MGLEHHACGPAPRSAVRACAAIAALWLLLGCGSSVDNDCVTAQPAALINAGETPSYLQLNEAQSAAIVAIGVMRGGELWRLCSGTLIAPRVVLTAGHCADGADQWSVRFGPNAIAPIAEVTLDRSQLVRHLLLDLMLIKLPADFSMAALQVEPLSPALKMSGLRRSTHVQLAGFGSTRAGSLGTLGYLVEPVKFIDSVFITVTGQGRSGACEGDSGGPLLFRDDNGAVRIWGVLSAGSSSCRDDDVYIRLDRANEWLAANVDQLAQPSSACGPMGSAGRCYGDRAVWCEQGELRAQSCRAGSGCGYDVDAQGYRCVDRALDPCEGISDLGRCDGVVAQQCDDGVLEQTYCGACGQTCLLDPATGAASCASTQLN